MDHDKKCMRWRKQFKWLLKIPVCMILRESALGESLAGHWVPISLGKERIPSFLPLNYNPFTYNVNALTMVRFWNLKCFWNLKWNSEMLLIWPPDQATKHTQRAQRKVEKQEGQFWGREMHSLQGRSYLGTTTPDPKQAIRMSTAWETLFLDP